MKYCPLCGFQNPEYAKFCIQCGAVFPDIQPTSSPEISQPSETQPKPAPYAAPPNSGNDAPKKRSFSLRVWLIAASCILLIALMIGISTMLRAKSLSAPVPSDSPSASPPTAVSLEPSPNSEPVYTYQLDDAWISEGPDTMRYIVSGKISITSDTQLTSAYLCAKVYYGENYITEGAKFVEIHDNKIEFSIDVYISQKFFASKADTIKVVLSSVE